MNHPAYSNRYKPLIATVFGPTSCGLWAVELMNGSRPCGERGLASDLSESIVSIR